MSPNQARLLWKALVGNAARLISDSQLLLDAASHGRARSLTVLAQEELGKAIWIYDEFQTAWSSGSDQPRAVEALGKHGRDHVKKYLGAVQFGDELAAFWGDYTTMDRPVEGENWEDFAARRMSGAEAAAKSANIAKQHGFYVDVVADGTICTPAELPVDGIAEDLEHAAQVVEMLLIKDHSRMKLEATTPYDSTHEQQFRLLPVSHPAEFAAWMHAQSIAKSESETKSL